MQSDFEVDNQPPRKSGLAETFSIRNIIFTVVIIAIAGGVFYFMWLKRQKPVAPT